MEEYRVCVCVLNKTGVVRIDVTGCVSGYIQDTTVCFMNNIIYFVLQCISIRCVQSCHDVSC